MTTKSTSLSALKSQEPTQKYSVGLTDSQGFELAQRAAKLLSSSTLVPKNYQGNVPDCVIALNMANRVGADPLMVMQNLVIVHGRPTWSAQFLISTVNTCGKFTALRYEFFGEKDTDSWGCRACAIEKTTGEKLVGTDISIKLAKDEGWYTKNGSKWKTMPQQMLMYRAGSWWARAYAPELSMGLQTAEEVQDFIDVNPDGTYTINSQAFTTEDLRRPVESADVVKETDKKTEDSTVNPDTGEVIQLTFAQVADQLNQAKTLDDLYVAADAISLVADETHQKELRDMFSALSKKFD